MYKWFPKESLSFIFIKYEGAWYYILKVIDKDLYTCFAPQLSYGESRRDLIEQMQIQQTEMGISNFFQPLLEYKNDIQKIFSKAQWHPLTKLK